MVMMEIHQEVVAQREALAALVRRIDPDELPASQAPALWRELDVMGRQIAAAKTLVARRVEDSHRWKGEGFASPAEYLAAHGGTSISAARTELEMSKALPTLPATRAALVEGTVSPQQGALIADAARVNPGAERSLLEAAGRHSFKELRDDVLRAKAAGDPDPEATQCRIHQQRTCTPAARSPTAPRSTPPSRQSSRNGSEQAGALPRADPLRPRGAAARKHSLRRDL